MLKLSRPKPYWWQPWFLATAFAGAWLLGTLVLSVTDVPREYHLRSTPPVLITVAQPIDTVRSEWVAVDAAR